MSREGSHFVTSNFALTAFLELNGLRFVKAEVSQDRNNKIKVDFYFLDPHDKGMDLELDFRFSSEKKYRDLLFHYRKIINDKLGR